MSKSLIDSALPIKDIPLVEQQPFVEVVDKILAIIKTKDCITESIKQTKLKEYERQIDQMVYKLYDLTRDEIKIIENPDKH